MTDTANNNNENQNFHENSPQFSDSADYSDSVGKILQDARIKQKIDIKTIVLENNLDVNIVVAKNATTGNDGNTLYSSFTKRYFH